MSTEKKGDDNSVTRLHYREKVTHEQVKPKRQDRWETARAKTKGQDGVSCRKSQEVTLAG